MGASASSDPQASGNEIRMVGWLKKYGGIFQMFRQDRWVQLTDKQLIRSKERDGEPNGMIDLDSTVTAIANPDGLSFTVKAAGIKYTFIAESQNEQEQWTYEINAVVANIAEKDSCG